MNVSTASDVNGNFFILGQRSMNNQPFVFENQLGLDTIDQAYFPSSINRVHLLKLNEDGMLLWSKQWSYGNNFAKWQMNTCSDGSVVLSTLMRDTIDLDPGIGEDLHYDGDNKTYQVVLKLDEFGNYLWGHSTENGQTVSYTFSTVDNANNVYCAGSFNGTLDVAFGAAQMLVEAADTSLNGNDIYLEKISPSGTIEWVKTIGQNNAFNYPSMLVQRDHGFAVYGTFTGDSLDIDAEASQNYISNPNPNDYISTFELNYNAQGVLENWDVLYSDFSVVELSDYARGPSDERYLLGVGLGFIQSVNGSFAGSNAAGNGNLLVKKENSGQVIWMQHYANNLYWAGATFTDRLFIAGSFMDTVDFDASPNVHQEVFTPTPFSNKTTFILSVREDGDFLNVYRTQSPAQFAWDITSNPTGRLMMMEYFEDSLTNLPFGTPNQTLSATIVSNAFYIWDVPVLWGISEQEMLFSLYPNPTSSQITIISNGKGELKYAQLLDATGKMVSEWNALDLEVMSLSVESLEQGMYTLLVSSDLGQEVHRIIKN